MGFHHVALATHDAAVTHRFYTDVMGFHLVKVVAAPNPPNAAGVITGFGLDGYRLAVEHLLQRT